MLAQSPASTESVRIPATMIVEVSGEPLRLEADAIAGLEEGPVEASGSVIATFRDLTLTADHLAFDQRTGEGRASGSVTVTRPPHRLQAESLTFDVDAGTAEAVRWRGRIDGAIQAQGRLLTIEGSRSVALDTTLSPCLAEDPGYRFEFARLDWFARPGGDTVEGRHSILKVSEIPVFWLPYWQSTFTHAERRQGPEVRTQVRAGYDGFDGFYLTSSGDYELAPGWTGRIPLRATTERGITVGLEQRLPLEVAEGRLDAFYTTPFPGNPGAFIPGPRANLSLLRDVPGGVGLLSLGYRVDVGNPFRIGPYPSLSNQPVSRLPELAYFGATRELGPTRWTPSARLGYLIEEGGASSPLGDLTLSGSGPEWWLPGRVRVVPFGFLRGNAYRSLTPAELAAGGGLFGRMGRGVGQVGLSASAEWWGIQLGGVAEAVRVVSASPTDADGTPFMHDAIGSQDRLSGSARRHLIGPLSVGVDGVLVQPQGPSGSLGWVNADLGVNLNVDVNCLSVRFDYRPLIKGWSFSYLVTTF